MIQKIRARIFTIMMMAMFAVPMVVPVAASALVTGCNDISSGIANGANQAASGDSAGGASPISCDPTGVSGNTIGHAANSLVTVFSIIVGAVSVIMIIYGGFRYVTSGGDSGRVGSAKNTLIYAIIGLVIVALAQLIVHFVLNQSTAITAPQ
jgi:hypothetical protein